MPAKRGQKRAWTGPSQTATAYADSPLEMSPMVEGLKPDLKTNRRIARTAILTLLGFSTIAVGLCLRLDWLLGVGVVVLLVAFFFTPRGTPSIGAGQSSS